MKKTILSMLALICGISAFAQPQGYVFTVQTGVPYQKLSSPTVVTYTDWDDFSATIPLGFKFKFLGDSTTSLVFDSNEMNVGTDLQFHSFSATSTPTNGFSMIIDLVDHHVNNPSKFSFVGYKQEGTAGDRVCKIEWNNCGLLDDPNFIDSLNAQLWLYENGNKLEYRIGPSSRRVIDSIMSDPSSYDFRGPIFGLVKNLDPNSFALDWLYFPSNLSPASMDSADITDIMSSSNLIGLDTFPNTNTVLRWAPAGSTGINGITLNENISVYPSIVTDRLNIRFNENPDYTLTIANSSGAMVCNKKMSGMNDQVDLSHLAPGNYFLCFSNRQERIMYRITKQ